MAQEERSFATGHTADAGAETRVDQATVDAVYNRLRVDLYGGLKERILEPSSIALPTDPTLLDLIKSKFVGYFRWTAFAMLFAPVVFWIISKNHH
jgi:hypothetical protein